MKTICLSTHIGIFDQKIFPVDGGHKVIFVLFSDVKSPENQFLRFKLSKNASFEVFWQNFVPIWGPYRPLNYFSHTPLNFAKSLHLRTHMTKF